MRSVAASLRRIAARRRRHTNADWRCCFVYVSDPCHLTSDGSVTATVAVRERRLLQRKTWSVEPHASMSEAVEFKSGR
jgi:hypothetical protein